MNIQLKISQILVYYDFPHIFTAIDEVGTDFLCLLVSMDTEEMVYLSTSISNNRLIGFLNGSVDLREIFENPEIRQWYLFNSVDDVIIAKQWEEEILPNKYLPDKGFSYKNHEPNNDLIISESLEYKNAVVHLAVSDSQDNYSIDADDLGDVIKLYQIILENTYKKELAKRKIKDKKAFYLPKNYKLRAFASSYGSFNVHLYSTSKTDLFGNAIIELGLEKFDEITRDFDNADNYIESLRSVKGHPISTLRKLMKKLIDENLKIKHKWYSRNQEKVHFTQIDPIKAERIYEILNSSEELSEEIKVFFGFFVQVDVKKGTWRIFNLEDEKEYNGEASNEILQGVTVETVNYKLTCKEIIEAMKVSEKEKIKYILQTLEKE